MLGDKLKELRQKRGLSQQEISSALKINRGTYAHYEINKRQPDFDTLKKLAAFFNVDLNYLLEYSEPDMKVPQEDYNIGISEMDNLSFNALKKLVELFRENRISSDELDFFNYFIRKYVDLKNAKGK